MHVKVCLKVFKNYSDIKLNIQDTQYETINKVHASIRC